MKKHSFRALPVLLVCFALLLGLSGCGQPAEPSPVPLPETFPTQESSEEPLPEAAPSVKEAEPPAEEPPLGFSGPDWLVKENAALEAHFQELLENREEVLALLNQRLLSFREGSFEETPNHHAPWPEDFPPPQSVEYPLTCEDYVVWMTAYEPIDETSWYDGELSIWVRLDDQSHYMVLEPAWFGSADSEETTLGFSDSRFSAEDPFFGFDDVWNLQNPQ
ncbi:MAG: hypothetical protein IKU72_01180 [Oscillospiraceae bacterium]|nr:hypothetical protein [Oscillospiraceae bacterium]